MEKFDGCLWDCKNLDSQYGTTTCFLFIHSRISLRRTLFKVLMRQSIQKVRTRSVRNVMKGFFKSTEMKKINALFTYLYFSIRLTWRSVKNLPSLFSKLTKRGREILNQARQYCLPRPKSTVLPLKKRSLTKIPDTVDEKSLCSPTESMSCTIAK